MDAINHFPRKNVYILPIYINIRRTIYIEKYGINNVDLITSFIDQTYVNNKVSLNKLIIDRTNPIILQYLFFNDF